MLYFGVARTTWDSPGPAALTARTATARTFSGAPGTRIMRALVESHAFLPTRYW